MRILVTGDNGLLGSSLVPILSESHDVVGIDHSHGDIADADFIQSTVSKSNPEVIVHLAAFTAVDRCEQEPDLAFRVNELGTQIVADAARSQGAHLITVSTDYVFDGLNDVPYRENDAPNPVNVYGRSKLAAETAAKSAGTCTIIRSAWLFGPHRSNFVTTILGLLEQRDVLQVVDDQTGSPTYTLDLAHGIGSIVDSRTEGLYHLVGGGSATWFELAQEAVRLAGKDPSRIAPVDTETINRPAPRPGYSVLNCGRARDVLGFQQREWQEALLEYIQTGIGNLGDTRGT